ncbi:hypothetical protein C1J03_06440 [Sulfitobacter sp. SK012]|nr:hypothetical protein C1J03_06440 [Sulfitobacter sp. SK012]
MAARNNADLYAAMFTSHGLRFERFDFAFVGKDQPPPYYGNLTVVSPDHEAEVILQIKEFAVDFGGTVSLKDSFCQLDLTANGFKTLFEASWFWRGADSTPPTSDWRQIDTVADLELWEQAWKASGSPTPDRMFHETLLKDPDVVFLGRKADGVFDAGCIANRSRDCMGVSNVFSCIPSEHIFAQASAAVSALEPGLPLVGYGADDALEAAQEAGFTDVGALRVLATRAADF